MRFVYTLFAIIFTLLSLVEIFGGSFWFYRALNAITLVFVWLSCKRPAPVVVPVELEDPLPAV